MSLSVFYYCISLLLSQFQPIFVSFVTIAAVLRHFFKAMSLVKIFTPTGPHNKISKMSQLFMQLPLVSRMPPFLQLLLKTPKQMHV